VGQYTKRGRKKPQQIKCCGGKAIIISYFSSAIIFIAAAREVDISVEPSTHEPSIFKMTTDDCDEVDTIDEHLLQSPSRRIQHLQKHSNPSFKKAVAQWRLQHYMHASR
jgi:hypothetical protein